MPKPVMYPEKILLALTTEQLAAIDRYAAKNRLTRTEAIRRAVDTLDTVDKFANMREELTIIRQILEELG